MDQEERGAGEGYMDHEEYDDVVDCRHRLLEEVRVKAEGCERVWDAFQTVVRHSLYCRRESWREISGVTGLG